MLPYYESKSESLCASQSCLSSFPPHVHVQMEILYVVKGRVGITVAGQTKILHKGELAVVFPNMVHTYEPPGEEGIVRLAIFGMELVGNYRNMLLTKYPVAPFLAAKVLHRDIAYAMRALVAESKKPDPAVCRALVQLLLARVSPLLTLCKNEESAFVGTLHNAICYLSENYREAVTLESVARALHVSRFQLSRLFSDKLNMTFTEYVNQLRVNSAKDYLRGSELSILQIAYECGFTCQRTFNRVFLEICGVTPRKYRDERVPS